MRAFGRWVEDAKPRLAIKGTVFACHRPGVTPRLGWDSLFEELDVIRSPADILIWWSSPTSRSIDPSSSARSGRPAPDPQHNAFWGAGPAHHRPARRDHAGSAQTWLEPAVPRLGMPRSTIIRAAGSSSPAPEAPSGEQPRIW